MFRRQFSKRRLRFLVGIVLGAGLLFECQQALLGRAGTEPAAVVVRGPEKPNPSAAFASPVNVLARELSVEELAAKDPIAFLQSAVERYDRSVRDYTCTFSKQELIAGQMSAEQVMKAMFREKPFSIRLEWVKNADKCARVLYVADRWVEKGQQMAVVEPGAIARLFVPYVMRAIHGPDAEKSSRRTIDQFGVRNSLMLTLKYAQMAKDKGILDFRYMGNGNVNGRNTLVFERHSPYDGEGGTWPDRVLVVHLDKEFLLPTLCTSFADDEKKVLLGRYMVTDINLNINLPDSTFTKEGMGL